MRVRTISEAGRLTADPRGTGRMLIKLIDAGPGSTADYPDDALREAATRRMFPAGTHMYLDHANMDRRTPSGGRSLRDLASVTTTDAVYDETTNSLIAEAQAIAGYADLLESIAPHVGLSISALAECDPPTVAGGKPVVRSFVAVESVDWVAHAGRGGEVLALLESAGIAEAASDDRRAQLDRAVRDAYADRRRDVWAYLRDFDDVARIAWFHIGEGLYAQPYTVAADDLSVTLTGERAEVRAVTTYVPVQSGGVTTTTQEASMPEITEAQLNELRESASKVATLESERDAATKRAEDAEARLAADAAARTLTEARTTAARKVAAATEGMPAPLVERVTRTIEASITGDLPADLDAQIAAVVETERAYAQAITPHSRLTGFGQTVSESATPARTTNAFGRKIQED